MIGFGELGLYTHAIRVVKSAFETCIKELPENSATFVSLLVCVPS